MDCKITMYKIGLRRRGESAAAVINQRKAQV
jgi:hypothetical protein